MLYLLQNNLILPIIYQTNIIEKKKDMKPALAILHIFCSFL
ncbi:hypothetical protein DORLON_01842 [Dorea longicatena DSM 13814]|uniref:Uncharacterized protein n=1 Tax=Dorea longicatena DSM 13814 TaxID=411462 RepID=A6BHR7_9FIRM|nr:hypothetical protein DORLON_01842 [Dorea longicatena DSM 13814]